MLIPCSTHQQRPASLSGDPRLRARALSATIGAMENICPAKDKNANVFVRVLHEACRILGGEHELAEYLGVRVALVEFWLDGRGQPPDAIFLRCSDLLHEQSWRTR